MKNRKEPARHSSEKGSSSLLAPVNAVVNWIEHIGAQGRWRGKWYHDRFYRRLIERELKSISLSPGATVLHIGCGPLPMTAIYLAKMGFQVKAIDYDAAAVRSAREVVGLSYEEKITVCEADGRNINCSSFDAVWISLVVGEKRKIVGQALKTLRPGAPVLYRNYRGPLMALYPRLHIDDIGVECESRRITHALGKETVIVWVSGEHSEYPV